MDKFKISLRCKNSYKLLLAEAHCSITISIGHPAQEEGRFAATIAKVNTSFCACTIMVCDLLQRYSFQIQQNLHEGKALDLARLEGDLWLERNQKTLSLLSIPCSVFRWDEWLFHDKYKTKRELIDEAYDKDSNFRVNLNMAADQYLTRLCSRKPDIALNYQEHRRLSLLYLKEECAVMLLWADNGYNFELYPSARNLAMQATHGKFIKKTSGHILEPIRLDVRSKKIGA